MDVFIEVRFDFQNESFPVEVFNNGLYTNNREKLFRHLNGQCKLCLDQDEPPNHMFLECTFARDCWTKLLDFLLNHQSRILLHLASNLLHIFTILLLPRSIRSVLLSPLKPYGVYGTRGTEMLTMKNDDLSSLSIGGQGSTYFTSDSTASPWETQAT